MKDGSSSMVLNSIKLENLVLKFFTYCMSLDGVLLEPG